MPHIVSVENTVENTADLPTAKDNRPVEKWLVVTYSSKASNRLRLLFILLLWVASAISCRCQHLATTALPFPSGYHSVVDLNILLERP